MRHACRLTDNKLTYGDVIGATGNYLNGQETMAQQLSTAGALQTPFLFVPGTEYCYTNANFNLAAYVVEKVSIRHGLSSLKCRLAPNPLTGVGLLQLSLPSFPAA